MTRIYIYTLYFDWIAIANGVAIISKFKILLLTSMHDIVKEK